MNRKITVLDPAHNYKILGEESSYVQTIQFKKTKPSTDGSDALVVVQDGTTNEVLIEVLIDRLSKLQEGFGCKENACAITHLEEALHWLEARTKKRIEKGVEGKPLAH